MRLPPLGDRKPSVMLAEMLEFCPARESSTAVFACLFLQRLPHEIWVLLSEDDPADMWVIADKAERLIAMHVPQSHESCTAVAAEPRPEEPCVVAAAQAARSRKGKRPPAEGFGSPHRPLQARPGPGDPPAHLHVLLLCQVRRTGKILGGRVQLAGKLGHRGIVSAIHPGHLFFVTDSSSHCRYLVDTGSAFSIMPWWFSSPPAGPGLSGADGRRIPCWGEQPFTVTIGRVPRQWTFLLAAVSFPILGIDVLHPLVVDVANQRLSSPSPRVSAIVPGRSYAKAVRSPLVVPSSPFATAGAASPPLAAGE
jgi:hypothetical protein